MAKITDIPSTEDTGALEWLKNWLDKVRMWVQTRDPQSSSIGDPADKFVTRGELGALGLYRRASDGSFKAGDGWGGGTTVIQVPGAGPGSPYVPDPTPPPQPTGLAVSAGISHLLIEWDAPTYTQGHGNAQTNIYGAIWEPGDPVPTFSDPRVHLIDVAGRGATVWSYATNPNTRWCIWIKWQSVDGVESTNPDGGTNGVQATTGQDVRSLLAALSAAAADTSLNYSRIAFRADQFYIQPECDFTQEATPTGTSVGQLWYKPSTAETKTWDGAAWQPFDAPLPFLVQTAPTTINGVTIPAGVYMDSAYIYDLTASIARLGTAWIDDAMVGSMSAAKLTAGAIAVGEDIRSTNYVAGVSGWRLTGSGSAQLPAAYILGQLVAAQINSNSLVLRDAAGNVTFGNGVATGLDDNLCGNPRGDIDNTGWAAAAGVTRLVNSVFGDGDRPMLYTQSADTAWYPVFRVFAGEEFFFSITSIPQGGGVHASGYPLSLGLAIYDEAGTLISVPFPAVRSGAAAGVVTATGSFTIPAGSYQAFVYMRMVGGGDLGSINGYYFRDVVVRRKRVASTFISNATIVDALIASLHASKIVAGSITTTQIQVGAASVANNANYFVNSAAVSGTGYDSGVFGGFSLSSTGSFVKALGSFKINGILSSASSVKFIDIGVELYIDGALQMGFGGLYPVRPVAGGGVYFNSTIPVIWRGQPTAGSHTYQIRVTLAWHDVNGNAYSVAFGTYSCNGALLAEENKV